MYEGVFFQATYQNARPSAPAGAINHGRARPWRSSIAPLIISMSPRTPDEYSSLIRKAFHRPSSASYHRRTVYNIYIMYMFVCRHVCRKYAVHDLHVGKKKNDHDETDYLTSFHSRRLISLSIFIYVHHKRNRIFNSRVIKIHEICLA